MLNEDEAYLRQITIIPDNVDYIEYNNVPINSLPVINVKYYNSSNNRRHVFTPDEKYIINVWATNINIVNNLNKWNIIRFKCIQI
mgnify:CR=1 FL=1